MKIAIPHGPVPSASYSFKTALVLHFTAFQVGWSVMIWFCSNISSECSTWSLFNILWNRKLMNEDTTTIRRCQIFPEMIICTYVWIFPWWLLALCYQGHNFELGRRKSDSCLSYLLCLWPWTRDMLLLYFKCST